MVRQAKTDENIKFVFSAIKDARRAGFLTPEHMATRALEGRLSGSNGKGLVDVLVFKRALLSYLLTTFMPNKSITGTCKMKIADVCRDHTTFRKHVGFKDDAEMPDMSWKAAWPSSADTMFGLIEDTSSDPNNPVSNASLPVSAM